MADKSEYQSQTQTNPSYPKHNPPNVRYPPAQPFEDQGNCFERSHKNKPQSNSVGIASLIFVTGGMSMAWGLGFSGYPISLNMRLSWFIGAIIGAIIGAVIVNRLQKKLILLPTTCVVILGGIIFTALSNDPAAVMAARYINGIANGIAFVVCLVMAGEESIKSRRGMLTSVVEATCFNVGLYTQIIFSASWAYGAEISFTVSELHGILIIFYGLIALICGVFLIVESPIYFLVRDQEQEALESLRRLQRPFVVTTETYEQLLEHKAYITENKELTFAESAMTGLPALLKLCIYRGMIAMTFSMYTSFALLFATINNNIINMIMYGTMRYVGTLISGLMMDAVGRKKPLLFGSLICGGMAIGVGYICDDNNAALSALIYLLCVYQFFAGIFVTASSTYLSEAFPLAIKNYYIAAAFIVEMLVQIIITCCTVKLHSISEYFYVLAVFSFLFVIFGIFCLPETKKTTLREAQAMFKPLLVTQLN